LAPNAATAREEFPEPLPVICWDWTKAIALQRVRLARRVEPLGTYIGLGRDALGLSHLTLVATITVRFHQLDQPPFPCISKICLGY